MKRRHFLYSLGALGASLGLPATAFAADGLFDVTLPGLDGSEHALRNWLGKPVVANFWATWCPPCIKEMPDLQALHKKYPNVNFLGLAVDSAANVRTFNEKVQVDYPLLVMGHEGIARMRELGNRAGGLPFTVVFDRDGKVAERILGQVKPDELERLLQGLIA